MTPSPAPGQAAPSPVSGMTPFREGPLVVKAGGSLMDCIPRLMDVLTASGRDLLIVPGGGRFADAVREAGLPDEASHWMAICAMEQMAWCWAAAGAVPVGLDDPIRGVCVLLSYGPMRKGDPLPHTWEVTSDTIAAWVAHHRGAPLLLLKSVDGIPAPEGGVADEITAPVATDVVDPCVLPYLFGHRIPAFILNARRPGRVRMFLAGIAVEGTYIKPIF
jgi:aspartokinase-like uncharacterized kinase